MWNITNRNYGLDVIRAVAILLVIISHCTFLLPEFNSTITDGTRLLGATGVDMFFVLSGFLIGGLIIKRIQSGHIFFSDLIHFWKRRWFRTLPNYFVILIFNILLIIYLDGTLNSSAFLFVPFLQNFTTSHPDFFTEAWSLSIEEYAYILLPALIYFFLNVFKTKPRLKVFLLATIVIIAMLYGFKVHFYISEDIVDYKHWSTSFRKVVLYRLDAIYYGFIAAYFFEVSKDFGRFKILFLVFGLSIFISLHGYIVYCNIMPNEFQLFYTILYLPLISLSILLTFPWFVELNSHKYLKIIIRYLSTRSYAIYLVNYSFVLLTIQRFFSPSVYLVVLYLLVTFFLSELLYTLVELPMLKLRDRKVPK